MNPDIEYDWAAHDARIRMHYDHARRKHPYFCDHMVPPSLNKEDSAHGLRFIRDHLRQQAESGNVHWDTILQCEISEALDALANGDDAAAVEELYDCAAVLLRTIDVLEGRQKLGKPETEGEAK